MWSKKLVQQSFQPLTRLLQNSYVNFIHPGLGLSYCQSAALRPKKPKSDRKTPRYFADSKRIRAIGGKGGDGCISFLQLWSNDRAGPDGGDGGNGGHIVFEASTDVSDFKHVLSIINGDPGENGGNKDCHGKNAKHTVVPVPVGTILRDEHGRIVGDLERPGLMFVAARGGAGGKGNKFFASSTEQSPKVCEYGPVGEDITYQLEIRSMADIGLIGFPNAGKSTLLNAISRAKPKVAPYAFTTLRPHLGIVHYEDHMQLAVADLPGLIPDSHRNKGLGIQFLKHAERCTVLLFLLDAACERPWTHYEQLQYEMEQFSVKLAKRPQIIVANKMDQIEAQENIVELRKRIKAPLIEISAKMGTNLAHLLKTMREYYEQHKEKVDFDAMKKRDDK